MYCRVSSRVLDLQIITAKNTSHHSRRSRLPAENEFRQREIFAIKCKNLSAPRQETFQFLSLASPRQ